MRTRTETILEIDLFDLVNYDKILDRIEDSFKAGQPVKRIELSIPSEGMRLWGIDVEVKQT